MFSATMWKCPEEMKRTGRGFSGVKMGTLSMEAHSSSMYLWSRLIWSCMAVETGNLRGIEVRFIALVVHIVEKRRYGKGEEKSSILILHRGVRKGKESQIRDRV